MLVALLAIVILVAIQSAHRQIRDNRTVTSACGADRVDNMIRAIAARLATMASSRMRSIQGRATRMASTHGADGRSVAFLVGCAVRLVEAANAHRATEGAGVLVTGFEVIQ